MEQNKCPMCGNTLIGNAGGTTLTCTNTQCSFSMGMDCITTDEPKVIGVGGMFPPKVICPNCKKEMTMVLDTPSSAKWECQCGAIVGADSARWTSDQINSQNISRSLEEFKANYQKPLQPLSDLDTPKNSG
jgi:hypothetical protein